MQTQKKHQLLKLRRNRIRNRVAGTAERPRMVATFSNAHIYVQFIDDAKRATIASASTRDKSAPKSGKLAANAACAAVIGKAAAEAAKAKGISKVVFDRAGAAYHGKVKALADAAREAGLLF